MSSFDYDKGGAFPSVRFEAKNPTPERVLGADQVAQLERYMTENYGKDDA